MSEKTDQVIQQIAELTKTIQEHGARFSDLDRDRLVGEMKGLLDQQREALLSELPARPGEFQTPAINRAVAGYTGKYARELRDIAEKGGHRFGNWELRGADLIMAKVFIERCNQIKSQGHTFPGSDKVKPVSEDLDNAVKALSSTGSGTGDELVPTGMAAELWQDFFAASRVVRDLPSQPMPTDPFDMPLSLGDVTWRKGTQGAASTASDPATVKSTLTSTEQVAEVDWNYNLDEDSVVAVMPALRQRLSISGAEQMDAFALNADSTATATGNINSDDATPGADNYYLSDGQDGILHLALVDNTGQQLNAGGDALADADLSGALALMGKYGLDINNVRIVPGIESYFKMLGLTNVATIDRYGPNATILTGELMKYQGVPVLPSASIGKAEADGKKSATAASNTLGRIALYHRLMWRAGFRRGLLFEVDRNIRTRQLIMVASFRIAVAAHGTRSTTTHTAFVRNFTL